MADRDTRKRVPGRPAIRVWRAASATQPQPLQRAPQIQVRHESASKWRLLLYTCHHDPLTHQPATRILSLGSFSSRRDAQTAARALAMLMHLDYLARLT